MPIVEGEALPSQMIGWAWLCAIIGVAWVGHVYAVLSILVIKVAIYHALSRLLYKCSDGKTLLLVHLLFPVIELYTLGSVLLKEFPYFVVESSAAAFWAQAQDFVLLVLLVLMFLAFVLSLQEGLYREQFNLLSWAVVVNLLVVLPASSFYVLVFKGLAWFLTPLLLVPLHAILCRLLARLAGGGLAAYSAGLVGLVLLAQGGCLLLEQEPRMHCPQPRLDPTPFSYEPCSLPPLFQPAALPLPGLALQVSEFRVHVALLCLAVSLIRPLSGYLSVGLKGLLKQNELSRILGEKVINQVVIGVLVMFYLNSVLDISPTPAMRILAGSLAPDQRSRLLGLLQN